MSRAHLCSASLYVVTAMMVVGSGCARYSDIGTAVSPSSVPTSVTPTPIPSGGCNNQSPAATQFIVVSPSIQATADPTYGQLFGYGLFNQQTQSPPSQSAAIELLPTDVVQFVNFDLLNEYSAVGFGGATFPPVPFSFPTAAASPIGDAMGSAQWSTGLLGADGCFSQTFTLPAVDGNASQAVLFGDLNHYNSNIESIRGVVIVSNSASQSRSARGKRARDTFRLFPWTAGSEPRDASPKAQ